MKSAPLRWAWSICICWIFYSFDASTCFIAPLRSLSAYHTLTFIFTSLLLLCLSARLQLCLTVYLPLLFVCLGLWAGLWQGVALLKPSSGIKWQRVRQALSHYARPPIPAVIESSDPKLMERGAGAHLLSAVDVLKRQTSEQQWQCWICSVDSDTLLHTFGTLADISLSVLLLFQRDPSSGGRCEPVVRCFKRRLCSARFRVKLYDLFIKLKLLRCVRGATTCRWLQFPLQTCLFLYFPLPLTSVLHAPCFISKMSQTLIQNICVLLRETAQFFCSLLF